MKAKQNIISKDKLVDFLPMRGNVGEGGGGRNLKVILIYIDQVDLYGSLIL